MDEDWTTQESQERIVWDLQPKPTIDRPYHTKRPHTKSRSGCKNCKTRKVKCDEARPACKHCQLRKEVCMYPVPRAPTPASSRVSSSGSSSRRQSPSSQDGECQAHLQPAGLDQYSLSERGAVLLEEPFFTPPGTDTSDMRLLWLYSTTTYVSFSTNSGKITAIDDILRIKFVQYAFNKPFLMDAILGLASLHLKHLGADHNIPIEIPPIKALSYRARAFEGYRKAVEAAKPEDYAPILAGSLVLCALSSEALRDPDCKPLYIIDWMIVWRGIGLVVDMISPDTMFDSGLAPLFFRPPIDLEASALHIPSNLLFMVTSIKEGDSDYPYVDVYYDTLKYLGSLYRELTEGFSGIFELRVIVWFTFLPKHFVELARQFRPRTLIILAHYLVFTKLIKNVWWMDNIANAELNNIQRFLGSNWRALLRVPVKAIELEDRSQIAKLLLGNHAFEPEEKEKETRTLSMVDDVGKEVVFMGGFQYQHKSPTGALPVWSHKKPSLAECARSSDEQSSSGESIPSPPAP